MAQHGSAGQPEAALGRIRPVGRRMVGFYAFDSGDAHDIVELS